MRNDRRQPVACRSDTPDHQACEARPFVHSFMRPSYRSPVPAVPTSETSGPIPKGTSGTDGTPFRSDPPWHGTKLATPWRRFGCRGVGWFSRLGLESAAGSLPVSLLALVSPGMSFEARVNGAFDRLRSRPNQGKITWLRREKSPSPIRVGPYGFAARSARQVDPYPERSARLRAVSFDPGFESI